MDTLTPTERCERMGRVKGKNTRPELRVRSLIHRMGYRYRLHRADLPSKPDLVFPRLRKVIFVHGCFWHRHSAKGCRLARLPKSRLDFWLPKLQENFQRDARHRRLLRQLGWKSLVVWECQVNDIDRLSKRIKKFLSSP